MGDALPARDDAYVACSAETAAIMAFFVEGFFRDRRNRRSGWSPRDLRIIRSSRLE
jgi:hypothetical protein